MAETSSPALRAVVDEIYRTESRRVFATLIRLLGDFDQAEEALHDAFAAAVEQWPVQGVPANPRAWLISAGRFKTIDAIRRKKLFQSALPHVAERQEQLGRGAETADEEGIEDDRLRLIFSCCHPALAPSTQVPLTLREVCGLTTEEIASAYLVSPATMAQRIVRGKAKIRQAKIPYVIPAREELPDRLDSVLSVIYLVFNEGYSASSGASLTRRDLSEEAIRLGRLIGELMPAPEATGLLALMLLQESRRQARTSPEGDIVLLENQDRGRWNRALIDEGRKLVESVEPNAPLGPYRVQASIALVHALAPANADTNWSRIASLYDSLLEHQPSPVVELNRAVAVAMRDGPAAGLTLIDQILARGVLGDYYLAHAARADLCRRLGLNEQAREAYLRAMALTRQEPERRFLERRLRELG